MYPSQLTRTKGLSLRGHYGYGWGNSSVRKPCSLHPESNGIIEKFHRTLKTAILSRMQQEEETWLQSLPFFLLGLRASVPSIPETLFSPIHHLLISAPRLPLSLVESTVTPNDRNLF
uniref:Integrase catalytic domain-containing protein n=1 Tax=Lepeophtheirus salmonis TaxID=72036 RepID=A0A0K2U098_LEPSM